MKHALRIANVVKFLTVNACARIVAASGNAENTDAKRLTFNNTLIENCK